MFVYSFYIHIYTRGFLLYMIFFFFLLCKTILSCPTCYALPGILNSEISMFLDFDLGSGFKVNVQPATHGTQVRYILQNWDDNAYK